MLSNKDVKEIREHLHNSQNPVFLYDNDVDGLCSFIVLRKLLGRGKGVAVRTHPDVDSGYAKRVQQLNADYVFVLDRPHLGKEFVEEMEKLGIPIIWIDHHEVDVENYEYGNLHYYNSAKSGNKKAEPVTFLCYEIAGQKENIWLAMMGCISDHFLPDFAEEFAVKHRAFWGNVKKPFDAYYGTEIGRLARSVSFGLKDSITHVVYLQNFLISSRSPEDVFSELERNSSFAIKYREISRKYEELLKKARKVVGEGVVFFSYAGDVSISSDVANALSYEFPGFVIAVAYTKGSMSNLSLRGRNVKAIIEKLLPGFEDSSGGGHPEAVGARIRTGDLERFKTELEKEI